MIWVSLAIGLLSAFSAGLGYVALYKSWRQDRILANLKAIQQESIQVFQKLNTAQTNEEKNAVDQGLVDIFNRLN